MPVQYEKDENGCFVRWGDEGKKYRYTCDSKDERQAATAKAVRQGRAIKSEEPEASMFGLSDGEESQMQPVAGVTHNEAGQPVRSFLKDLIHVGTYTHPVMGWSLDVTEQRMDAWVGRFRRMRETGVDIEVVTDHSMAATDVHGYLVDMFREGDTLWGVHQMIGEEGIGLAGRVRNVSVYIEDEYVDSNGTSYGEVILHSSLVQQPVVPDQIEFVPIAASRGGKKNIPIWQLERGATEMNIEELRKALGVTEAELTEENAVEFISNFVKQLGEKDEALGRLQEELKGVKGQLEEGGDNKEPAIDPDIEEDLAESAEASFGSLVDNGHITPAVKDALCTLLIGESGKRNSRMLSRRFSGGDTAPVKGIINALKQNDPVKLGEQTGHQVKKLNRSGTPDDRKGSPEDVKGVTEEMAKMV